MPPVLVVALLILGALALTRISGLVMRRTVRRMAESTRAGRVTNWWRVRTPRGVDEAVDVSDARRRLRVDAAARMLNHMVALVVWVGVTIAVFHVLDLDAQYFLSSAGFIGAAIAIGGQHKVNDYLTGLSVLFEDRYGVGDELIVDRTTGGEPVHAVVEQVGLFTTRLRNEASTLHLANGQIQLVRNLSQEAEQSTVRLRLADHPELEQVSEQAVAQTVRDLAGTKHLTEVIFVGDLSAERQDNGDIDVAVRTTRPLDSRSMATLADRAETALRGRSVTTG